MYQQIVVILTIFNQDRAFKHLPWYIWLWVQNRLFLALQTWTINGQSSCFPVFRLTLEALIDNMTKANKVLIKNPDDPMNLGESQNSHARTVAEKKECLKLVYWHNGTIICSIHVHTYIVHVNYQSSCRHLQNIYILSSYEFYKL